MFTYGLDGGASALPALGAQVGVAGREYTALNTVGSISPTANVGGVNVGATLYGGYYPIKFTTQVTVAQLVLRAGLNYTGATTLKFRVGIYNDNNGVPGSLLIDAGTIDWTNIAQGAAVPAACSQVLAANTTYWVVVGCSISPSGAPSIHITLGNNLPMANIGLNGELGAAGYYFNHNGANPLPSTAAAVSSAGYNFPRVYVKLAS